MIRQLLAALLLLAGLLASHATPAEAQYFGRNKVQYRTFDFQVLETENFDIFFYEEKREAAMDAGRMAERAYAKLSRILQHEFRERKPIILYASHADFQQTNAIPDFIDEGMGAFAESAKDRIVIPFTGAYAYFDYVLTHELVHIFQFDILFRRGGMGEVSPFGVRRLPLWFMEGMAEYLSLGEVDPLTAAWLRDAVLAGYLRSISEMSQRDDYLSYRFGQSLFAYIGEKWGDEVIGLLLQRVARYGDLERAFRTTLGLSLSELSQEWVASIRHTYMPDLVERQRPDEFAHQLTERGRLYDPWFLAPAISPDGNKMVYISQRDIFFDLWLADARTGEVERKLVGSARSADFESVRFLSSSAAFSPDGRFIAFSAQTGGRDALYVYDVQRRRQVKQLRFPLNGIANPSWSPDGQRLVFTGLDGGVSDLFITDLDGRLTRLTDDRFAALLPAWSPDGRTIAFTTDRGSDFDRLAFSNLQIALLDVESGRIEVLPHQERGKNLNAVWSPDGRKLIWVSDRFGTNDLFLFELDGQRLSRLTDLLSGAIAVTPLSPVLAWAKDTGRFLFVYFESAGYNIYAVEDPLSLPRTPVAALLTPDLPEPPDRPTLADPDSVPPRVEGFGGSFYRGTEGLRQSSDVPEVAIAPRAPISVRMLLDSAEFALADTADFTVRDYSLRFTPDLVGLPEIGVEAGHYGNAVFGESFILLSDMLGDHNILLAGAVDGTLSDAGFIVGYESLRHRANYNVILQQIPLYRYLGARLYSEPLPGGQLMGFYADEYLRDLNRQLSAIVSYPFSSFRRFELGATAMSIRRDRILRGYDVLGNPVMRDSTLYSARLLMPTTALVFDNALFGWTGPVIGTRYRLQLATALGDFKYTTGLVDFRNYLNYRRWVVFATRFLHINRSGRDADLFLDYWGGPYYLRGYNADSFGDQECLESERAVDGGAFTRCPARDQLIGSNAAIFNAELRFPIISELQLGWFASFPPVDAVLFFDGGLAWSKAVCTDGVTTLSTCPPGLPDKMRLTWRREAGEDPFLVRQPLFSYGAGLRINLFLLVLRMDYAIPLSLPERRGVLSFSIGPSF